MKFEMATCERSASYTIVRRRPSNGVIKQQRMIKVYKQENTHGVINVEFHKCRLHVYCIAFGCIMTAYKTFCVCPHEHFPGVILRYDVG